MLGAIVGDIVGSKFEWCNVKSKDFEFFGSLSMYTDDSVMTLAVAQALMSSNAEFSNLSNKAIEFMQELGKKDPDRGYGAGFHRWLLEENPQPYNSYGNGAAMRVSPCGDFAKTLEEAEQLAVVVTKISHNHEEGIKGAACTAGCGFIAKSGGSKEEIRDYAEHFYDLDFTLDEIRPDYRFNESCQETVPQAIVAFLESTNFEDAIRCAISIGGDSDTIGAITGGIAENYYGIPQEIKRVALGYLPEKYIKIIQEFYKRIGHEV